MARRGGAGECLPLPAERTLRDKMDREETVVIESFIFLFFGTKRVQSLIEEVPSELVMFTADVV